MPQQKDLLRLVYKKTNWLSLQKINPNNWKWHLLGKCTFNKRKYNLDLYDAKVYKNKPTDEIFNVRKIGKYMVKMYNFIRL